MKDWIYLILYVITIIQLDHAEKTLTVIIAMALIRIAQLNENKK